MYDVEEYLHLALHASANRDPHACLGYLKEALALEPGNSRAVYLLALQHAEIGLIERGIAGLEQALALEPKLEIARVQLGLLMIDRGRTAEAREQFVASQASHDQALRAFSEGMMLTLDGQLAAAAEKIRAALVMSSPNPALRPLAQEVLKRLEQMQSAAAKPATNDNRISMGAYAREAD